eukprot:CAMPEP_0174702456 /NCGR_PEP_ID=MMETSP1094-20130205/6736_1 /TAXON_ID=156173 /ORGANISM="Chrysochromulina brevifilum, Strain UTEX LB 985" /LENGTH=69 /DNA_ID=CAMNT_0015900233 /DNA_START=103 /DNA_END=312 /DNA_ORIENTATION=-
MLAVVMVAMAAAVMGGAAEKIDMDLGPVHIHTGDPNHGAHQNDMPGPLPEASPLPDIAEIEEDHPYERK